MKLPEFKMINQNAGFKAKAPKALMSLLILVCMMVSCLSASAQQKLMVRIAEIEIDPAYLEEYKAILAEEAAASVNPHALTSSLL